MRVFSGLFHINGNLHSSAIEVFDDYVNQYGTVDRSWNGNASPLDQFEDRKSQKAETHGICLYASANKGRQTAPKEYNLDDLPDIKYKINLRADKLRIEDELASPVKVDVMNSVSSEHSRLKHKHFQTQVNSRVNSPDSQVVTFEKQQ